MKHPFLLAGLITALLAGGTSALAQGEGSDNWKVMSPVELEAAAEAALPKSADPAGQVSITRIEAAAADAADTTEFAGTTIGGDGPPPGGGGATGATAVAPPARPVAAEDPAGRAMPRPAANDGPAYLAEDQPFKLKDYEEPKKQEQAPWWQTLLSMLFKLAIVIAMLGASLVGIKKLSGGQLPAGLAGALGSKGKHLVVLESTSLGPSQQMHLVLVGGDRLLVVGAGPQGLTTLATVDDPSQVRVLLAASHKGPATPFNHMYDLESVVQAEGGTLYDDSGVRRGWGG